MLPGSTFPAGSPRWWLDVLSKRLDERWRTMKTFSDYYDGEHKLAFATSKFREAFGELFEAFSDNWCELVVDASVERLTVRGFRFGNDLQADQDAWAIWQANSLDADAPIAHTEAVKCGEAFLLVAPGDRVPRITVEHPSQVIVATAAGDRRRRLAALKRWVDDSGRLMATVYLPDAVYRFQGPERGVMSSGVAAWGPREPARVTNPFGVVPMVPLRNNPSLLEGGRSDLRIVIPLQDGANKLVTDMLVASEFAAFRQRWATGLEVPKDPETGEPLASQEFRAAISRLWSVETTDTNFGEFSASDLSNYVRAIEMIIQHVAAQTRTPPHYLLGQSGSFPSGESLAATETGLVAKVQRKQLDFSEGWEEAMRLAFRAQGDEERATAMSAETIWADPESRTEGEHVDALLKQATLGIPKEALWERAGYSPQEIERFRKLLDEEAQRQPTVTVVGVPNPATAVTNGAGAAT